jgi:hypothetical protein
MYPLIIEYKRERV